MKNLSHSIIIALLAMFIMSGCSAPCEEKTAETTAKSSIEGTWEMVVGKWIVNDSVTIDTTPGDSMKAVKIINGTHFCTLFQHDTDSTRMGYNGGTYSFDGDIYTENLPYFYQVESRGQTNHFKVSIVNDLLTLSSSDEMGKISNTGFFETWRKVN